MTLKGRRISGELSIRPIKKYGLDISGLFSSGQGDIIFGFQFFRDLLEISERGQPHKVSTKFSFHLISLVEFPNISDDWFA